jgi:ABC-type transport system involved in cytochrome c biogenesis permease component
MQGELAEGVARRSPAWQGVDRAGYTCGQPILPNDGKDGGLERALATARADQLRSALGASAGWLSTGAADVVVSVLVSVLLVSLAAGIVVVTASLFVVVFCATVVVVVVSATGTASDSC